MTSMRRVRFDPYLIVLLVLVLPSLAPLAAPGYWYDAHDGRHSVFFLQMFDAAIRDDVEAPPLVGVVHEAHLMAADAMDRNWTLTRLAEPDPTP